MSKYLQFVSMGFELIGLILVGVFFGQKLDTNYAQPGLFQAGFVILALIGWLIRVVVTLKRIEGKK